MVRIEPIANRWRDADAEAAVGRYHDDAGLALRVYSSRLLGSDPALVIHGGGNTSVKTSLPDLSGTPTDVLCVKGSGWDLATIEAAGLPALRLEPLRGLRRRDSLSDEAMVQFLRAELLDPAAPNPSVETLLHAFLPHRFVDHAHAVAVLAISDQPDGMERCRELYGRTFAIVPYVMPGFALAQAVADAVEERPDVAGVILHKHGIFTFGDSARESYDRMIDAVTAAEDYLSASAGRGAVAQTDAGATLAAADVAAVVRGACATPLGDDGWRHQIAELRSSRRILEFVNGRDLPRYASAGVVTPDHNIRIKNRPLILPPADAGQDEFRRRARAAADRYRADYRAYFERNNAGESPPKTALDPSPRLALVPGYGLIGLGPTAAAATVAADLGEIMADTVLRAEAIGRFEGLPESELFQMEYWSLEQAKLGRVTQPPLAGRVVFVTGAGGAIGRATAALMLREGAAVVLSDVDEAALAGAGSELTGPLLTVAADVTDRNSVETAMRAAAERFGGIDIVVSNAGAAFAGAIGEIDDAVLRQSFELNFFAHHNVAQAATRILRLQGTGGCLLFNASKQAVNPGPGFGAYGTAKAATLALARQYALEYGRDGIRSNAVNADRIRSGLLSDAMIRERAAARGVSEKDYLSGNLLGREVRAADVARAFLQLALAERTTGATLTVDGGNVAAALR